MISFKGHRDNRAKTRSVYAQFPIYSQLIKTLLTHLSPFHFCVFISENLFTYGIQIELLYTWCLAKIKLQNRDKLLKHLGPKTFTTQIHSTFLLGLHVGFNNFRVLNSISIKNAKYVPLTHIFINISQK